MKLNKLYSAATATATATATAAVAVVAIASFPATALAFDGWHLEDATAIPGKGSAWDYVSLDAVRGHLFFGRRNTGLQVYDIATHKAIAIIGSTATDSSNGATVMQDLDLGISYNENGTITPFKLSTLEAQSSIKLG